MGDDTWFYFILVLIQGYVLQVSSADVVIECSKQCGVIYRKNTICKEGYGMLVTNVNVSAQTKDEVKEEKLKSVIRHNCDAKVKCNLDNLPVELSTILPTYTFSKVNISHECVELFNWDISFFTTGLTKTITHVDNPRYLVVRPDITLELTCDVVDADRTGAVNVRVIYLEFNKDRTLSRNDQVKITGCNQTVQFNVSSSTPMACSTFKIEINLTKGFLWMEIKAQKTYHIRCISHYANIKDTNTTSARREADVLLIVVGVAAVLAIFIIIGMCLVYVCHIKKIPKRNEATFYPQLNIVDEDTEYPRDSSQCTGQSKYLNNEPPGKALSSTSPDFSGAGENVALAAIQEDDLDRYTYVTLDEEFYSRGEPPVTSVSVAVSSLLTKRENTSQQRMFKPPMAHLQSLNTGTSRDLQIANCHPATRPSSDADFSNQYTNLNVHPSVLKDVTLPSHPHQPPADNSAVYNSLNFLDGTYTHLKHVNPPERVIDNVYDG